MKYPASAAFLVAALLSTAAPAEEMPMTPVPFTISVPDDVLDDLRTQLRATRFPDMITGSGNAYGLDTDYLREIVSYWATDYDWRAEEARLNRFDQFVVEIDGQSIHYVTLSSGRADAIPLLMLHGWPSSFVQMLDIAPLLTTPESGQAFDLVIPSLVGYGFSPPAEAPGMSVGKMAPLFHGLMTEVLGHRHYGMRSSDLGAGVATAIALVHPDAIIGHHTGGTNPFLPSEIPDDLTPEEQRHVADAQAWSASEMAYLQLHATKPQTLGVALNDSPAGLAAWIGEKFLTWTDNDGRIEDAIDRDAFLTNLTIYWVTESITSSMRLYHETFRDPSWGAPRVPTGYLMPAHDMFPTPRSWIERQGPVGHWTDLPQGGHFPEWEEPEAVANDLRAFFGGLR